MKLRLHTAVALAVAASFVACDKKSAEAPKKDAPQSPSSTVETTARPVVPKPDVTPAVPPADIAVLKDAYGIAARLPADAEGFSVSYRLHDLWAKLSASKWSSTLLSLPAVTENPKLQDFIEKWKTLPQAQMTKNLLEALFGTEFAVVQPAGFSDKFMPWVDVLAEFQALNFQRGLMTGMSGGKRPDSTKLLREAAPDLIPLLVKCDVAPLYFAFKATKARADIDAGLGQIVKQMAAKLPPGVELGQFKLADKYEFQSITITAKKLIAAFDEARLQLQLKELLGDEAKAKEAMTAVLAKRAEVAWGWVDDYFILSLGTDHSHVKFAAGDADSALAIPDVARRAAQFLPRKPLRLGYVSAAMFQKISQPMEFANEFDALTEELAGIIKPEQITAMRADVKRLEDKAKTIFTAKHDAAVGVDFWDGGLRSESFGGTRQTMLDSSKPLAFASLFSPSVFLLANGRANPATSAKVADFIEEAAGTLWGWYEKYGRTMVPESERQGAAMVESLAIPMVKDFWRASRQLSKALGDESALVLDLNGTMPKLPMLPPAMADGKIPRGAWVWELKDRAAVSEAWKGFDKIIKQLAALAPQGEGAPGVPEPTMKKEGDLEIHFVPLPIPTDDLLPHIAITKDRWMISTSPGLSKDLASKPAATGNTPLGSEWRIQFPALCDLGTAWLQVMDKDPAAFFSGTRDLQQYKEKMRPLFGNVISLMRSLGALEWRVFEEDGKARNSVFLKLDDLK